MLKSTSALLFCAAIGATPAVGQEICQPTFTPKASGHSEVINYQRKWTGTSVVDASRCAVSTGPFTIEFVRLKEVGADLAFREAYTWSAGETEVSLDLTWDEWISAYRVADVQPCPCRR
jgi:hypothetical protein